MDLCMKLLEEFNLRFSTISDRMDAELINLAGNPHSDWFRSFLILTYYMTRTLPILLFYIYLIC